MHYRAPDNSLHFLDDDNFVHLLPAGTLAITDEEAEALRPVPPPPTAQDLLAKLDADNTLTQRNLREFILITSEALKQATSGTLDLTLIPGVANVLEVEAKAAALRAQL